MSYRLLIVEDFFSGNCVVFGGRAKPDFVLGKKLVHLVFGAEPLAGPDFSGRRSY